MKSLAFLWLILLDFQLILVKAYPDPIDRNQQNILRVFSTPNEPFIYRTKNGKFHNGIEYKLIKTIAEKENLKLIFDNNDNPLNSTQLKPSMFNNYDIFIGGLFPNLKALNSLVIVFSRRFDMVCAKGKVFSSFSKSISHGKT